MKVTIDEKDKCPKCKSTNYLMVPTEWRNKSPKELENIGADPDNLYKTDADSGLYTEMKARARKPKKNKCLDCGNIYVRGSAFHKKREKKPKQSRETCDKKEDGKCMKIVGYPACADTKSCPRKLPDTLLEEEKKEGDA